MTKRDSRRPGQAAALRQAGLWLALALVVGSCDRNLPDPDDMPASYGSLKRRWLGCPDLTGLYAWPPLDHPAPEVQATGRYGNASRKFLDLPVYGEAQIWVNGPSDETKLALEVRTRMVNRDPRLRIRSLTEQWSFRVIPYECEGGWVVWDGQGASDDQTRSGRMALLADGSLAVGQATRESDRRGPLFGLGGQSFGDIPLPDEVRTGWARLRRIGPTGRNVPADDAGVAQAQ